MGSDKSHRRLNPGTVVVTTYPNEEVANWTRWARSRRKWGVRGMITASHSSHGLCYEVRHADGTKGYYDPTELKVILK